MKVPFSSTMLTYFVTAPNIFNTTGATLRYLRQSDTTFNLIKKFGQSLRETSGTILPTFIYALNNYLQNIEKFLDVGSSLPEMFCKKAFLKNFVRFTGKHLCQSLFHKTTSMTASVTHRKLFVFKHYIRFYLNYLKQ